MRPLGSTCRSPAVCTALHVLRSLKLPSVALHVVECTFQRGFDSFRAHQPLKSKTYGFNPFPNDNPLSSGFNVQLFVFSYFRQHDATDRNQWFDVYDRRIHLIIKRMRPSQD